MTARLDERDPLEPAPWQPVSSEWARRQAREAVQQAVRRSKDSRKPTSPADGRGTSEETADA